MNRFFHSVVLLGATLFVNRVHAQSLPKAIVQQLPAAYSILTFKSADFNADGKPDFLVVLQNESKPTSVDGDDDGPSRPLLVFMQGENAVFTLIARNDRLVYGADHREGCDPFDERENALAVKGAFFTIENAMSCGSHWIDYFTFKYSKEQNNFFFHKRTAESWVMNPSNKRNANALILDSRSVSSAIKGKPVSLQDYEPD